MTKFCKGPIIACNPELFYMTEITCDKRVKNSAIKILRTLGQTLT